MASTASAAPTLPQSQATDAPPTAPTAFPIVGIGGSAGALQALLRFFEALPAQTGMAFVVVLHLSPDHESNAPEILQRSTSMPVMQVKRKTRLEPDHVYVIPPGLDLLTEDGHVQTASRKGPRRPSAAIDVFFRTLADVHQQRAIAVVLSGTGSDGSVGVTRIKECEGITIAQDPEDAEFSEMPRSAIDTETVDFVLSATEIARRLVELSRSARSIRLPGTNAPPAAEGEETPGDEAALAEILSLLRSHTRNDFRHYKRATVLRRLGRRMQIHGLPRLEDYRRYLREHPEEAKPLLQDMLISVTNFFRDPPAFERLERLIIPKIFESLAPGEDLRVWVAGCATGEEGYSIGMLLREHADKLAQPPKIVIFATDINEEALAAARQGVYPRAIEADVSTARLARYFQPDNGHYRVARHLRDQMLFAKHNVLADPAFSKVDLICCRNLLIYLDAVAQKSVLESFAYALRPGGILFLGNAESPQTSSSLFTAVDQKHRIYRLNSDTARIPRMPSTAPDETLVAERPTEKRAPSALDKPAGLLHQRALLQLAAPSILIDDNHEVLHRSAGVGAYLTPGQGVPSHNLADNIAPDLRLELRTALFKAQDSGEKSTAHVERRKPDGTSTSVEISVHPVPDGIEGQRHWVVMFAESAPARRDAPRGVDLEQRSVVGELQKEIGELKSHLQDTLDRSAEAAEESKAANEELQAINEELRSATEELETSKEELQSMNEELVTVNYELRMKVDESARTNDDLRNLMASSDIATVFVDGALRIKRFTPQATKLFHLIASDIGRPLLDIRSRLKYDEIADDAIAAFQELRVVERHIESTDDQHFYARVLPYRTAGNSIEGSVLTFFDVTRLHRAEERAKRIEERLRDAVEFSEDFAVLTTDAAGTIVTWNAGAERIFGYTPEEIIGESIDSLFTEEDRVAGIPGAERLKAREAGRCEDERWHRHKDGTKFFCSGVMASLRTGDGLGFAKIARDITAGKRLEVEKDLALRDAKQAHAIARVASDVKDEFLAVMSHELKQPLNLIQVNAELLTRLPELQSSRAALRIGDTIQRAVGAQTRIVNDLLDLSRIRTGKMSLNLEPVDVVEVVRTLVHAMGADAKRKDIAIEVSGAATLFCSCDHVRIEQIAWNLLGNALKFTPNGGRIRVDVQEDAGFAKLSVADSGIGLAEDFLPHAFEMFSQGKAGGSGGAGLGIGLALVDALALAHGGRVEAASGGTGRGSTFTVWLPLHSAGSAEESPSSSVERGLAGQRVLVVDDDADSVDAFAMLLELEGAHVQTAGSGEEALRHLRVGDYDLLISDLSMPRMGGLALVSEVRKTMPAQELRAIAVTGFGREADVARALEAGFDAHVSKPASVAQIKAALRRLSGD